MSAPDFSSKKKKTKKSKVSEDDIQKIVTKATSTFEKYSKSRTLKKDYKVRGDAGNAEEVIEILKKQLSTNATDSSKQIWEDETKKNSSLQHEDIEIPAEYNDLLERIFKQLDNLQASSQSRKVSLQPPQISRLPKKTMFVNFQLICKSLQRSPDHFLQFLLTELETTASIDGDKRLILRGTFSSRNIENILRRYIKEYVECTNCHSLNTSMNRDPNTRLFNLECNNCGAGRNVTAIKAGYEHDLTKRRNRNKYE